MLPDAPSSTPVKTHLEGIERARIRPKGYHVKISEGYFWVESDNLNPKLGNGAPAPPSMAPENRPS